MKSDTKKDVKKVKIFNSVKDNKIKNENISKQNQKDKSIDFNNDKEKNKNLTKNSTFNEKKQNKEQKENKNDKQNNKQNHDLTVKQNTNTSKLYSKTINSDTKKDDSVKNNKKKLDIELHNDYSTNNKKKNTKSENNTIQKNKSNTSVEKEKTINGNEKVNRDETKNSSQEKVNIENSSNSNLNKQEENNVNNEEVKSNTNVDFNTSNLDAKRNDSDFGLLKRKSTSNFNEIRLINQRDTLFSNHLDRLYPERKNTLKSVDLSQLDAVKKLDISSSKNENLTINSKQDNKALVEVEQANKSSTKSLLNNKTLLTQDSMINLGKENENFDSKNKQKDDTNEKSNRDKKSKGNMNEIRVINKKDNIEKVSETINYNNTLQDKNSKDNLSMNAKPKIKVITGSTLVKRTKNSDESKSTLQNQKSDQYLIKEKANKSPEPLSFRSKNNDVNKWNSNTKTHIDYDKVKNRINLVKNKEDSRRFISTSKSKSPDRSNQLSFNKSNVNYKSKSYLNSNQKNGNKDNKENKDHSINESMNINDLSKLNKSTYSVYRADKDAFVKEIEHLIFVSNKKFSELTELKKNLLYERSTLKEEYHNKFKFLEKIKTEIPVKQEESKEFPPQITLLDSEIKEIRNETDKLIEELKKKQKKALAEKEELIVSYGNARAEYLKVKEEKEQAIIKEEEILCKMVDGNKNRIEISVNLKKELEEIKVSQIYFRLSIISNYFRIINCMIMQMMLSLRIKENNRIN